MAEPVSVCNGQFGREGIDSNHEAATESPVKIKNETETAVRAEIARLWGQGRHGTETSRLSFVGAGLRWLSGSNTAGINVCRCPHCLADILALALSKLPAGYCLSHHYSVGRRRVDDDQVKRQIQASLRRVGTRPRHGVGESLPGTDDVRLVDFGMREGAHMVRPLLRRVSNACSCARCRADTLAYGLNRSRPHYGVEVRGKTRMPPHELDFIRHDLLETLHKAARAVAENPRHDSPGMAEVRGESD